jgi:hypothetical protein
MLGGILGGTVAWLSKGKFGAHAKVLGKQMNPEEFTGPPRPDFEAHADFIGPRRTDIEIDEVIQPGKAFDDSLSAAKARALDPEDFELVETGVGLEKLGISPIQRVLRSPFMAAKQAISMMAEMPLLQKGHKKGKVLTGSAGATESRITLRKQKLLSDANEAVDSAFYKYRKANSVVERRSVDIGDMVNRNREGRPLNYEEFKEQVAFAKRRPGYESAIPEATEAAKALDEKVYRPLFHEMKELGILPKEIPDDWAATYLHRMYDKAKIAADRASYDADGNLTGGFAKVISDWLTGLQMKAKVKAGAIGGELSHVDARLNAAETELKQVDDALEASRSEAKDDKEYMQQYDLDVSNRNQVQKALGLKAPPMYLSIFIRERGGLADVGGEFAARDITNRNFPAIISKEGLGDDALREAVFDAGYFPDKATYNDVDIQDVIDILERDIFEKQRTYPADVQRQIDAILQEKQSPRFKALDEAGLTRKSKLDDFQDASLARQQEPLPGEAPLTLSELKAKRVRIMDDLEGPLERYTTEKGDVRSKRQGGLRKESENLRKQKAELDPIVLRSTREIADDSEEIISRIMGEAVEDDPALLLPEIYAPSAFRSRKLTIPDRLIEDYLVNDIDMINRGYVSSTIPDMELARDFGDAKLDAVDNAMQVERKRLDAETEARMKSEGASPEDIGAAKEKLANDYRKTMKDLQAVRDRLRGTFAKPADPDSFWNQTGQFLKRLNFVRLLGGMQISAIPDLARYVMTWGMRPFVRHFSSMGSAVSKLAREEIKAMGVAAEGVLGGRAASIAGIADEIGMGNKVVKGMDKMAGGFGKVTLMTQHNDFLKSMSGVMAQHDFLDAAMKLHKGGVVDSKTMTRLAKAGLDEAQLKDIARLVDIHGTHKEGLWLSGFEGWTKRDVKGFSPADIADLKRAYTSAINKVTNEVIVTPGAGEMPLFVSTPLGSIVMQFKSFSMSAQSRILTAGLQQRDAATLYGVLMAMALGNAVFHAKSAQAAWARGEEYDPEDLNWGDLVYESLDRSGLLGIMNEPIQAAAKFSGGAVNPRRLWGGKARELSRHQSRNVLGIFGPSTDLVGDFAGVGRMMFNPGDISAGDVRQTRRLIPYQNVYYLRWLFDQIQSEVTERVAVN